MSQAIAEHPSIVPVPLALEPLRRIARRGLPEFLEVIGELPVPALELRLPVAEVQTPYRDRPAGSTSKLRTYRDGFRILGTIFVLVKEERPLQFFTGVATLLFAASIVLGWPIVTESSIRGRFARGKLHGAAR